MSMVCCCVASVYGLIFEGDGFINGGTHTGANSLLKRKNMRNRLCENCAGTWHI